ncbi:hypothetical protein SAV14893_006110 [Streptomyces avermitilis]|uniref:Carbohydrate kinase PfkB domain-containing protein n=1 Tax=Streptomyces avermitilis TaxID=33903 RepID=A0A4D4LS05_STRAX|nr:hypothetical protein SAV14893_006110 [Streptomyces avermitilis]
MSSEIDVLVLGGAGVDTIVQVPELPLPYADSYMVPAIETRAGQTGDFVAVGVHALGLRTHHIDMIGDDREGDLVRALHRDRGIGLTEVPLSAGTKRAVNLVGPDGRRLSLYDDSRAPDEERLPPPTVAALAAASRHAHVAITHPCADALPTLRETGVSISTDLHNWDGVQAYHEAFAHEADIVFLSTTALANPEKTMRQIAERGRAREVVATAGAEGAYLLADGEVTHIPTVTPRPRWWTPTGRATPSPRATSSAGWRASHPGAAPCTVRSPEPTPARYRRRGRTPSAGSNCWPRQRS